MEEARGCRRLTFDITVAFIWRERLGGGRIHGFAGIGTVQFRVSGDGQIISEGGADEVDRRFRAFLETDDAFVAKLAVHRRDCSRDGVALLGKFQTIGNIVLPVHIWRFDRDLREIRRFGPCIVLFLMELHMMGAACRQRSFDERQMVEIRVILHKRDADDGIADLKPFLDGDNSLDFSVFRQWGVRVFKRMACRDGLEAIWNGPPCERIAAPCGFFQAQRLRHYNNRYKEKDGCDALHGCLLCCKMENFI